MRGTELGCAVLHNMTLTFDQVRLNLDDMALHDITLLPILRYVVTLYYIVFSYQTPRAVLCFPKGFLLFRLRRLENCHRISKSSEVRPWGLPNPLLSTQNSRLFLHRARIALRPGIFNKMETLIISESFTFHKTQLLIHKNGRIFQPKTPQVPN